MRSNKRFESIKKLLMVGNVSISLAVVLAKIFILFSGHNKKLYEMTGELVPVWSARIKLFSGVELFFASMIIVATFLYSKGFHKARYLVLIAVFFFIVISLHEIIRFVQELGANSLAVSSVVPLLFWSAWFLLNYLFLRSLGRQEPE
jgi:hypothetical protein